jgi:excisionase family DNA binding protein
MIQNDTNKHECCCNNKQNESELLTSIELAELLNVPLKTVRAWTLKNRLPVVHCGRLVRFNKSMIERRILSGTLLKD